jgi:hypothetical protein
VTVAWVKARLPVRSALFKQDTGGLVVRWVTTSESPLLYVFAFAFFLLFFRLPTCSVSVEDEAFLLPLYSCAQDVKERQAIPTKALRKRCFCH